MIKIVHRQDSHSLKNIFLCCKLFAENLIKKTLKRFKLIHNLRRFCFKYSSFSNKVFLKIKSLKKKIETGSQQHCEISKYQEWKKSSQKKRLFREDELNKFKAANKINTIHDITDGKVKELGQNFKITRQQDYISVYCLENNTE